MAVKILGIIPARYASTRLPGKLLIPIHGKTLLQRTFENTLQSSRLDKLLVATDDVRIFDHVKNFGGHPIMTSPNCLNGSERSADVLRIHPEFLETEAIVCIQGDEPCIDPTAIDKAVNLLLDDPTASMATLISPLQTEEEALDPSIVKCITDLHNNALYFSRSLIPSNTKQRFNPKAKHYIHIGLYVYRPSFLQIYQSLPSTPLQLEEDLEQLRVLEHGYRIKVAITEKPGIGVNTKEDLHKIEQYLCKQNTSL